jgi:hypothetical protein
MQLKDLQKKAKSATKNVGNPAQDFANKGKKAVAKAKPAVNKAKVRTVSSAWSGVSGGFRVCLLQFEAQHGQRFSSHARMTQANVSNPAREFAAKVGVLLLPVYHRMHNLRGVANNQISAECRCICCAG